MIVGIGVDVCEVDRFAAALDRTLRLRDRLFAPAERDLPIASLAARFAAKEAVAKALHTPGTLRWHDCVVERIPGGPPTLRVTGTVAARAVELGVTRWHLSLSHDAGIAAALVVVEH